MEKPPKENYPEKEKDDQSEHEDSSTLSESDERENNLDDVSEINFSTFTMSESSSEIPSENDNLSVLNEVADDMLHLIEKIKKIDGKIQKLQHQLDSFIEQTNTTSQQQHKSIELLRRDLISEKKAFVNRSTFNALLPFNESLETIKEGLDPVENKVTYNQITTIADLLHNTILNLGYVTYSVSKGVPFDPTTMECARREPGSEGEVIEVIKVGYRSGESIIRPVSVVVGQSDQLSG